MTKATDTPEQAVALTKKDFMSSQEIRWCPGCGDYSILAAVQKILPELNEPKEKFVFVSGIGCASRFPYYMNTYGFHTIHGRAPAVATGIKIANRDLSVWVISGDGDALSIGGNHFMHTIRRNVDLNFLLFNNEIYGLTKGQVSPTSATGTVTKSSPFGSTSQPVHPLELALGAGASFLARTADILAKNMQQVMIDAYHHRGTSFMEVLQNCHIFNDGVHKPVLDKTVRDDRILLLESGKPMIFGKDADKGIALDPANFSLKVVNVKDAAPGEILVHDPAVDNQVLHHLLAAMRPPHFPVAMGVIRAVKRPIFEDQLEAEKQSVIEKKGAGSLKKVLFGSETWVVS